MKRLCVLYDASCGFCARCRWWLAMQPQFVELEFVIAGSPEAARRFPGLRGELRANELVVIDSGGAYYLGPDAFLMCLWALVDYRELSIELSTPLLRPFARAAFELLSTSRKWISKLFGLPGEEAVQTLAGIGEVPG